MLGLVAGTYHFTLSVRFISIPAFQYPAGHYGLLGKGRVRQLARTTAMFYDVQYVGQAALNILGPNSCKDTSDTQSEMYCTAYQISRKSSCRAYMGVWV